MSLHDQIMALYDEEVAKHPEGIKVADAKEAITPAVTELILEGERDIDREVRAALNGAVDKTRDGRSRAIARDLDYILDYFANPDEAALIPDARMSWAVRLGTSDGADKTLHWWLADDFIHWAQVRVRQAQEVAEAADHSMEVAERVVSRIRQAGVIYFGDVDWSRP